MKYIIANHKMNFNYATLKSFLKDLKKISKNSPNQVGVCVPFVYLDLAKKMLKGSNVWYGAQNMYYEDKGTFTGEVSATMLNDFNCNTVVVGHSERRGIFGETNADANKKLIQALKYNLTPIYCFGEVWEEREAKLTNKVITKQLKEGLKNIPLEDAKKIVFAYEPVWAISSGNGNFSRSATVGDAQSAIKFIKKTLSKLYDTDYNFVVLYGGSLNPKNVNEILDCDEIDGGLIGGASLKIETFKPLVDYKKQ